jgi:acylphosphatase
LCGRYGAGMSVRRRVRVTGRVQGVGFRYAVAERARSRHVGGFVRNLATGQVEAAFEGEPDAVDAMVEFCRRGPSGARVDDVEVRSEEPRGDAGFSAG